MQSFEVCLLTSSGTSNKTLDQLFLRVYHHQQSRWSKVWWQSEAAFSYVPVLLFVKGRTRATHPELYDSLYQNWPEKPPVVETEQVASSAWPSYHKPGSGPLEGGGTPGGWLRLSVEHPALGYNQISVERPVLPLNCSSGSPAVVIQPEERQNLSGLGAAPEPYSNHLCFMPFFMGFLVNWLGSCVLACTFSPYSSRDHVPLIYKCYAV